MWELVLTPAVQDLMRSAKEQADALGHEYLGTEHILLAMLASRGTASQVLTRLGVDRDALRDHMLEVAEPRNAQWGTTKRRSGVRPPPRGELPITAHAKLAMEHSFELAPELSHPAVGTAHMLLGLLHTPGSPAGAVMNHKGLSYDATRQLAIEMFAEDPASFNADGAP